MKHKTILWITLASLMICAFILVIVLFSLGILPQVRADKAADGKYLMVYFTGNSPKKEAISYALSDGGYDFTQLNNGEPVLKSEIGTKSIRDPYILKGQDDFYYLVATDLKSEDGWDSNSTIITWKSSDLIHWTDATLIDMKDYSLKNTVKAWAPQAIYDSEKDMYMLYWSNCEHNKETDEWSKTLIWYAYTKDFKTLETKPKILFEPKDGSTCIDGDITYFGGQYNLLYKHEDNANICIAKSDNLSGPYLESDKPKISDYLTGTEGVFAFHIEGTDKYAVVMDAYHKETFLMEQTDDFVNFSRVMPSNYSFPFTCRHGSVVSISDEEYERLFRYYNND